MEEELRDALVQLCRRREVSRPDRLCVVLALLDGDDALALEVDLVARDDDGDVVAEHLLELLDPDLDAVEGAAVGDVVDEEGAVGVAVVDGPQGVETLLPGRVPDGQVYTLVVDVEGLFEKGGLNGGEMLVVEFVVDVTENKRGLPYTACKNKIKNNKK